MLSNYESLRRKYVKKIISLNKSLLKSYEPTEDLLRKKINKLESSSLKLSIGLCWSITASIILGILLLLEVCPK